MIKLLIVEDDRVLSDNIKEILSGIAISHKYMMAVRDFMN